MKANLNFGRHHLITMHLLGTYGKILYENEHSLKAARGYYFAYNIFRDWFPWNEESNPNYFYSSMKSIYHLFCSALLYSQSERYLDEMETIYCL